MEKKKIKVTLKKSFYKRKKNHQACLLGLGLKKINKTVVLEDTPDIRGMINQVFYMVSVEGVE